MLPQPTRPATSSSSPAHVLPRQQRQQRAGDRGFLLCLGRIGQTIEASSSLSHPISTTMCGSCALQTQKFPTAWPIRAARSQTFDDSHRRTRVCCVRRPLVNMFMGPTAQKHTIDDLNATISTMAGWLHPRRASFHPGRRFRCRPDRGFHRMNTPAGSRAGARQYRDVPGNISPGTPHQCADRGICPMRIRPSTSIRTCATMGLPAPRLTYDWRGRTTRARRVHAAQDRGIGRAMGAARCGEHSKARVLRRHTRAEPAWEATRRPTVGQPLRSERGIFQTCSSGRPTHPSIGRLESDPHHRASPS